MPLLGDKLVNGLTICDTNLNLGMVWHNLYLRRYAMIFLFDYDESIEMITYLAWQTYRQDWKQLSCRGWANMRGILEIFNKIFLLEKGQIHTRLQDQESEMFVNVAVLEPFPTLL